MSLADDLWTLTSEARWFGGRGRGGRLTGVRSLDPSADVQSLLLDVTYADGTVEHYHVPVLHSALPNLVEAADHGLELWRPFDGGSSGFRSFDALPAPSSARRFAGEQSNTNVFFDNGTMLKVLRRVEAGGGIEAELLEALRGGGVAPELHGTWSHDDWALGVLVETLDDPEDAYDVACAVASSGDDFTTQARELGATLARVHELLAANLSTGTADACTMADVFRRRFDTAARELPSLEEFREGATRVFDAAGTGVVPTQRVHGDCHLGQVLLTKGSWRYVDFEGEPMKSLAERRELDSPLRDVAGMLRSFAYATAAGDATPEWLAATRGAFLQGYGVATDPLLDAYELDKAVYEAVYETRFRPQLVEVPLRALRRLTHH